MIEKIKNLDAKLHADLFAELCVLDQRKVGVVEPRTDDHVAAQISETRHRGKHRRVKPAVNVPDDRNWSRNIRPQRVRHSVNSAVAGYDVDRTATLRLDNRRELPPFLELVAA